MHLKVSKKIQLRHRPERFVVHCPSIIWRITMVKKKRLTCFFAGRIDILGQIESNSVNSLTLTDLSALESRYQQHTNNNSYCNVMLTINATYNILFIIIFLNIEATPSPSSSYNQHELKVRDIITIHIQITIAKITLNLKILNFIKQLYFKIVNLTRVFV